MGLCGYTLPETNMETQKGPNKDYSPSNKVLYGFPCLFGGVYIGQNRVQEPHDQASKVAHHISNPYYPPLLGLRVQNPQIPRRIRAKGEPVTPG